MKLALLLLVGVSLLFLPVSSGTAAERLPWRTSRIAGTPDPPRRLVSERVFPTVSFHEPVDMAYLPGTDWLFVMELTGKVFAFDQSQEEPQPVLVFDARSLFEKHNHSYGLTFHPQVTENRYVYVSWTLPGQEVENGTTVSRFELTDESPPRLRPETQTDIIQWPSGGHNGACMKFGPDGYLYISAGDGVGPFPPDSAETGQDLSDLRSTIFRIDVNHPTAERPYSIPADNPFLDLQQARGEVWAYGFRNPWKMAFSPFNGDLLVGDVGWELWELVYRVERGGNYGWSVMEGRQPVRSDVVRGPTPILPPLADHHHIEARSVTGGYVYRGQRLPGLQGTYIYGDYVTGKIWGLRNDGNSVTWQEELADTPLAIITFGENQQGDLFVVDYAGGIYRLQPNPRFGRTSDFPHRLSETGLFAEVAQQTPQAGVIPYRLVVEPWMEGATARRFVALPELSSIKTVRDREHWVYPPGTVFAKTISTPHDESGEPIRRLETQILHFDGEQWHPYTYIWNEEQTDAELAPAEGSQAQVTSAGESWTWRFHSRAECNTCHTPRGGYTLGFFPQNLTAPSRSTSDQLADLMELKVFESKFPDNDLKPAMCDPYDTSAELDARARSYLMLNCAHCHRRGGGGTSPIEFPIDTPLAKTNAIDAAPTQGTFDIPGARIIAPGDPFRSTLFYRLATVGRGHMPHLGARRVDAVGLELIHDWIAQMPVSTNVDDGTSASTRRRQDETVAVTNLINASGDKHAVASASTTLVTLLNSTTGGLRLAWNIGLLPNDDMGRATLVAAGASSDNPLVRGLFERFLPESERSQRLGAVVDADRILNMTGDAAAGRQLFQNGAGVQCRNCHQAEQMGRSVGPMLDDVGKRLSRDQILESILSPSRTIDAKWVAHTLVTTDGRVLTGLLSQHSEDHILLRDSQGKDHHITSEDIDELVVQQNSLMPDLLVQDLTAEQLADLLAYLCSLRSSPGAPAQ